MPVLVFNKRTNRYLRRHSGSYHRLVNFMDYKRGMYEEILKRFGECPSWSTDREKYNEWGNKVHDFKVDKVCDANPEDARVYASAGSALTSVGSWQRSTGKMKLPDHFEIHEIKEAFMCIMRPDGSSNCDEEEVK
jgi:hypothetical protein